MFRKILFFLFILPSIAFAQIPPTGIQDEGGSVSRPVFVLNCVGGGVECTHSGITGTITVSTAGGGIANPMDVDLDTNGYMIESQTSGIQFDPDDDGTADLVIDSSGNVGIASANPDALLVVDGDVHLMDNPAPSDTENRLYNVSGSLFWDGASITAGAFANPMTADLDTNGFMIESQTRGLLFDSDDDGTAEIVMTTAGYLGVGVSSPANILEVYGPTSDSLLTVDASGDVVGVGTDSPNSITSLFVTLNNTNEDSKDALIYANNYWASSSGNKKAFWMLGGYNGSGATDSTAVYGGYFDARHLGSGKGSIIGTHSRVSVTSNGEINNGYASEHVFNISNGYNPTGAAGIAITNMSMDFEDTDVGGRVTGIDLTLPYGDTGSASEVRGIDIYEGTNAATIDTEFGIYVRELDNATDNFAIYTLPSTKSYFGGNIGILDESPDAVLEVSNDAGVTIPFMVSSDDTADGDFLTINSSGDMRIGTGTFDNPSGSSDVYVTGNLEVDGTVYGGTAQLGGATNNLTIDGSGNADFNGSMTHIGGWLSSPTSIVPDLAAADDNYSLGTKSYARTIVSVGCRCIGTCSTMAQISLEDRGGNAMTHTTPTCATTGAVTYQSVTAGGSLTAGEGLAFDVDNTPSPETDTYEILWTETRD